MRFQASFPNCICITCCGGRQTSSLNDELKDQQTWLKHILTFDGAGLNWLVDWVNISGDVAGITMADYWAGLDPDPDEVAVAPAFTEKGQAAVDGYIGEIEQALFEPLAIGSQKLDFKNWYAPFLYQYLECVCRLFPIRYPTPERPGTVEAGRCRHANGEGALPIRVGPDG